MLLNLVPILPVQLKCLQEEIMLVICPSAGLKVFLLAILGKL